MSKALKNKDLVYADSSGKIIGVVYEVYNQLGYGHPEKTYQKALAAGLKVAGFRFTEQLYAPVAFKGVTVGRNFLDFLVNTDEGDIALEIKRGDYFASSHIDQVYKYLVSKQLKLGLLIYFAPRTVHIKRVVNLF